MKKIDSLSWTHCPKPAVLLEPKIQKPKFICQKQCIRDRPFSHSAEIKSWTLSLWTVWPKPCWVMPFLSSIDNCGGCGRRRMVSCQPVTISQHLLNQTVTFLKSGSAVLTAAAYLEGEDSSPPEVVLGGSKSGSRRQILCCRQI